LSSSHSPSSPSPRPTPGSAKRSAEHRTRDQIILTMETIVIALLALATLGYLVVAVLCPEKF
jgi:hypothetical protein